MDQSTAMRVEVCNGATACGNVIAVQKGDATTVCKTTTDQHYRVWNGDRPSSWTQMGDRCLVFDNRKCFDIFPCSKDTTTSQCTAMLHPKNATAQAPARTNVPASVSPTATSSSAAEAPQMFHTSLAKSSCSSCGGGR